MTETEKKDEQKISLSSGYLYRDTATPSPLDNNKIDPDLIRKQRNVEKDFYKKEPDRGNEFEKRQELFFNQNPELRQELAAMLEEIENRPTALHESNTNADPLKTPNVEEERNPQNPTKGHVK